MLQGHFSMAILHNGSDKKIYGVDDQLLLPKRNYSWSTGCRKKWTKNFLESVEQIYRAVEENFSDTKTILHLYDSEGVIYQNHEGLKENILRI